MSTELTWQTISTDSAATIRLGEALGASLRGGEVIELISDIGGGKTTFVHGIVSGAGSEDQVASPSFTISRQYQAGDKTIYHFDFYRLNNPGIIANELAEFLNDQQAIIIIEWADIIGDVLPAERLCVQISAPEQDVRDLLFTYPEKYDYLIPTNSEGI